MKRSFSASTKIKNRPTCRSFFRRFDISEGVLRFSRWYFGSTGRTERAERAEKRQSNVRKTSFFRFAFTFARVRNSVLIKSFHKRISLLGSLKRRWETLDQLCIRSWTTEIRSIDNRFVFTSVSKATRLVFRLSKDFNEPTWFNSCWRPVFTICNALRKIEVFESMSSPLRLRLKPFLDRWMNELSALRFEIGQVDRLAIWTNEEKSSQIRFRWSNFWRNFLRWEVFVSQRRSKAHDSKRTSAKRRSKDEFSADRFDLNKTQENWIDGSHSDGVPTCSIGVSAENRVQFEYRIDE